MLRNENQEDLGHVAHADNFPNFSSATGTEMDLELPALIENDGNVERAETLSKELDEVSIDNIFQFFINVLIGVKRWGNNFFYYNYLIDVC